MTILITGGAGYIGSHTTAALLENGYDNIVVMDNLCNSDIGSIKSVERITGKKISFFNADIRDEIELNKIFTRCNISSVIHFAGLKSVAESKDLPIEYYSNNVYGTINLVKCMLKNRVYNLIFSSSATVYGIPEKNPLDENCITGGTTNPYGYSKYISENILKDIAKANNKLNITCLRYFNPVGAHPSGHLGENPVGIPNNIMPFISGVAIGRFKKLNIFGSDYNTKDGTGVRDYIHVMDLASGHLSALNKKWLTNGFRVYNLGTGKGYSVLELVKTFEKISNRTINYEFVARRPGDVAECWSTPLKAKKELGWEAKYSLENMIEDAWRWQLNYPNGFYSVNS